MEEVLLCFNCFLIAFLLQCYLVEEEEELGCCAVNQRRANTHSHRVWSLFLETRRVRLEKVGEKWG